MGYDEGGWAVYVFRFVYEFDFLLGSVGLVRLVEIGFSFLFVVGFYRFGEFWGILGRGL